jgi:hypothetical protein
MKTHVCVCSFREAGTISSDVTKNYKFLDQNVWNKSNAHA